MLLSEIMIQLAVKALATQFKDGSMPEGHNGPWFDTDTRVRTTAHWALTYYHLYERHKEERFRQAAVKCCEFLVSETARPHNQSFYCRQSVNLERRQNGLIGQAWALEALTEIGAKETHKPYMAIAKEVFSLHSYSYKYHRWQNVYINGTTGPLDVTLNQQIWFGSIGQKLAQHSAQISPMCEDFFAHLSQSVTFLEKGLISHKASSIDASLFSKLKQAILPTSLPDDMKLDKLSRGYQSFILFALFTYLKDRKAGIEIFPFINEPLRFSLDKTNTEFYKRNEYCYGYNVTGIELAFICECMGDSGSAQWWLNQQFSHTYDPSKKEFLSANVSDVTISQARIYEATRLKHDYEITI
jgi:hypothetical protein